MVYHNVTVITYPHTHRERGTNNLRRTWNQRPKLGLYQFEQQVLEWSHKSLIGAVLRLHMNLKSLAASERRVNTQ